MRVLRKGGNMYHKIVFGLMLFVLLVLALTVVTQGDRLEAQGNPTVLLPIPNVINVIVRCDLKDIPHRGMKVFWNVDERGYYRINGDGPSLPAQYQESIAGYEHIGYAGDMDITARNLSDNPSRWSNLRLEMYQSLEWPDGSYTRDWVPILNLNPSSLDCTMTVNNPTPQPTPTPTNPAIAAPSEVASSI